MPVTAALIGASIPAVIQLGTSAVQNYKAKKIAKNNIRPEYIPNEQVLQNADLTASRANTGLSDASLALATQENQRNLSQSLDAILRGGGTTNQIADLYGNNSDAMLKLASLDSQLQDSHIQSYLNANAAKGAEMQSAWSINQFAPYADKAQLATQLRLSAMGNFSKGVEGLSQAGSNYAISNLYKSTAPQANQQNQVQAPNTTGSQFNPYPQDFYDNTPSDNYIRSIIQSKYDPNAQQNLDLYNKGLYDPRPMIG